MSEAEVDVVRRAGEAYYEPEELIDAGERVILVMNWGGRGRGTE